MGKVLRIGAAAVLVVALVSVGGASGSGGAVVGFGLTGYLVWRAWPAVTADLRRLGRVIGSSPGGRLRAGRPSGDGLL